MRTSNKSGGLKVNAIAGTYVVTLGINLSEDNCNGLMGFSLHRHDHTENESYYLEGMKCFSETDPGFPKGARFSTLSQPIQDFTWSDYTAKPDHTYTYTVCALKGSPKALSTFAETKITITTESTQQGVHEIYFNRGVAGSQEYVRRFGDVKPLDTDQPDTPIFKWLSRGLYEGIENFVNGCADSHYTLRVAAYEFKYKPFAELLKRAVDRGVGLELVYDGLKGGPGEDNRKLAAECNLTQFCTERRQGVKISHNKFIVKLFDNEPIAVLTGGTNFTANGIFGHSNVAHVVKNRIIAANYLKYWELLKQDKPLKISQSENSSIWPTPELNAINNGITTVFSPRKGLSALQLYGNLALNARSAFFMTFAFGINQLFKTAYENGKSFLRFALMESKTRAYRKNQLEEKKAEEAEIQTLRSMKENIFAVGNYIETNKLEGWVIEHLSGLSRNVRYVHNKFMLIDPLSEDPVVVAGSANFSDASTESNDENMLVIRGDTAVADIYLGEFLRLWKHFSFRESLTYDPTPRRYLRIDNWWESYFGDNDNAARRKYFSQSDS